MSFRDWTRIAQNIHSLISAFRSPPKVPASECTGHYNHVSAQPLATLSRSTIDARFLREIERRRNSAYLYNVKNQIR